MKNSQQRSAHVIALILTLSFSFSVLAETTKIDLEKAKAELAKAKSTESATKKEESKTPRKRLFGRKKTDEKSAVTKATPKVAEVEAPTKKVKEASKSRGRLFSRDKTDSKKPILKKAETAVEEVAEKKVEEPKEKKRFSLFGKDRDEKKDTASAEKKPKPVPAKKESRLTRMLANDSSKKEAKKKAPKPVKVAKEKTPKKESSGSLFGLFKAEDSKKFAKTEKTKLGKSIESKPKPSGTGALTKKSNAGELGWYVVTEGATPFYAVGPGQPMPPEKILDRGSMLTVTKGGWGWCNVKLGGGELGVVSAKAMRPATIAEVNRHTAPVATASKSRGSRKLFNILSRGPAPELTLPSGSDAPIRNFGLLPSLESGE